ncbi:MAG: type I pantothenate kinase, partial [Micavibrio aeruginosavorus]
AGDFAAGLAISGSVAAGKSTTARILQALLSRWPNTPKVTLVTTDGFLFPNAYLQQNNLMERKGFPESYDTRRLLKFLHDIKAGQACVEAPVYSHLVYDIIPDDKVVVDRPDILILEGLNVLQVGDGQLRSSDLPFVSDFFDFSIYLDADEGDLKNWYIERFLMLRNTAFQDPKSYFRKYAEIDEAQSVAIAEGLWNRINLKNLHENILPTKSRAALILRKGGEHKIEQVALRKL